MWALQVNKHGGFDCEFVEASAKVAQLRRASTCPVQSRDNEAKHTFVVYLLPFIMKVLTWHNMTVLYLLYLSIVF